MLQRTRIDLGKGVLAAAGWHTISSEALFNHLRFGSFSLLSASNAGGKKSTPAQNQESNKKLRAELAKMGAVYHQVLGRYEDHHEESYLVHHTLGLGPRAIEALGREFEQETVLHSSAGLHRLTYLSGKNEGKYSPGQGYESGDSPGDSLEVPTYDRGSIEVSFNISEETLLSDGAAANQVLREA